MQGKVNRGIDHCLSEGRKIHETGHSLRHPRPAAARGGGCRCSLHEAADFLRRTSLHIDGDVRIGIEGEPGAVVAQHAGQGLYICNVVSRWHDTVPAAGAARSS